VQDIFGGFVRTVLFFSFTLFAVFARFLFPCFCLFFRLRTSSAGHPQGIPYKIPYYKRAAMVGGNRWSVVSVTHRTKPWHVSWVSGHFDISVLHKALKNSDIFALGFFLISFALCCLFLTVFKPWQENLGWIWTRTSTGTMWVEQVHVQVKTNQFNPSLHIHADSLRFSVNS